MPRRLLLSSLYSYVKRGSLDLPSLASPASLVSLAALAASLHSLLGLARSLHKEAQKMWAAPSDRSSDAAPLPLKDCLCSEALPRDSTFLNAKGPHTDAYVKENDEILHLWEVKDDVSS